MKETINAQRSLELSTKIIQLINDEKEKNTFLGVEIMSALYGAVMMFLEALPADDNKALDEKIKLAGLFSKSIKSFYKSKKK